MRNIQIWQSENFELGLSYAPTVSRTKRNSTMRALVLCLVILNVLGKPIDPPSLYEGVSGSSVVLPCPLSSRNMVVWVKGQRVLYAGDLRVVQDPRLRVEGTSLVVEEVEEEDSGVFRCQVEEEGRLRVAKVELQVQSSPSVTILGAGKAVTVREGASLALRCQGQGNPLPLVSWHKEDQVVAQGRGEVGLLLEALDSQDRGKLECKATNGVGEDAKAELLLDVLYAPKVDLLTPSLSPGGSCGLELQCMVDASGEAEVRWFRDNLPLLPSSPGIALWSLDSLHVLQLHACDLSLVAEYQCRAETRLGRDSKAIQVTEEMVKEAKRREQQLQFNTVRRNVKEAEAQPFTSSSLSLAGEMSQTILLIAALMLWHKYLL